LPQDTDLSTDVAAVTENRSLVQQTIVAIDEAAGAWIPHVQPTPDSTAGGLAPVDPWALQTRPNPDLTRFKIRLASTEGTRSTASYLIEKMYSWRGYAVSPVAHDRQPITIIASDAERPLATISIGFDSKKKLLVDGLYGVEVARLRKRGARLCEFTRLAVDRNEQSKEVLAMMFHIAYMYARRFAKCTDLLIEVNPRHVRFYRSMLGFEVLGEERACARVNAPAVLLRLDLQYCEDQIARYGGHRELAGQVRSLYPLGFSPEEEDGICRRLKQLG